MKRIYSYLFIAAVGLFGLTSCSSDDNTPIQETDYLLGKWDLNTLDIKLWADGEVYQEMEDFPVEGSLTMQFDFRADNTVEYYFYEFEDGDTRQGTGTYQRNGSNLTITIDDEADFEILLNDANNLHLGTIDEYEYQGIQFKDEVNLKFIKM